MTRSQSIRVLGALMVLLVGPSVPLHARQGAVVAQARALAAAGEHDRAITLLEDFVAGAPADVEARVLLGTVLSWEKRYDEARRLLDAVLTDNPTHGDALIASVNLELWSDHAERAELLARRGLVQHPADARYLLARAQALAALKRSTEARVALERLLAVDPRNPQAAVLRRSLQEGLRVWQARVGASRDTFSDDRVAWQEAQLSVSRATGVGPVTLRGWQAQRFGLRDQQFELESYPRLGSGTYAYVSAAYSPDAVLYPQYRYAADLYQRLGAGFEGSAGFRRLGFGSGINVYVGSLGKYYGPWLVTGRAFVTPDSAGRSRAYHASVRRYLGEAGNWLGVRYGRGAVREELRSLNDFEVLDSEAVAAEAIIIFGGRLELNIIGSYSRDDRVEQRDLRQYSLSSALGFRF